MGLRHFDGNTTLCMASRRCRATSSASAATARPAATTTSSWPTSSCCWSAPTSPTTTRCSCPRVLDNRDATVIVGRPAGHQDGDDRRRAPRGAAAHRHRAAQRHPPRPARRGPGRPRATSRRTPTGSTSCSTTSQAFDRRAGRRRVRHRADDVRARRARHRAAPSGALVAWTMGVNHSVQGTETVTLLNTLCLLTGNIGRPGAAPFSITGQCNAMGTRETGLHRVDARLPRLRRPGAPGASWPRCWGVDEERLPAERGRAYPDIINAVIDGQHQGPVDHRHQPGRVVPQPRGARARPRPARPARRAGRLRDADHRAGRRRAARRHLGREGRHVHEQRAAGVAGAGGRRRRRARPGPTSTSSSRSPTAWGCATSSSPGGRRRPTPSTSGGGCRRAACATTAASPASASTRPAACSGRARRRPVGPARRARRGSTPTGASRPPTGRAQLRVRRARADPRPAPPAVSACCSTPGAPSSTGTPARRPAGSPILERLAPEALGRGPPRRRRRAAASARATWCASSRQRGAVDRIRVRVTAIVRAGEVFVPFHWDERCANRLTVDEFDPISREPNYKQCAVRLERVTT